MIDWHCHIMPDIDDGPATLEESVEMARALLGLGYKTVHCTPHLIRGSFEADNTAVRTALASLRAELERRQISVRLLPGREYYLDEFIFDYLKDPVPLGETQYILIEIPNHMPAEFVKETCYRIRCRGYVPMIAHPERCALFVFPDREKESRFNILGSMFKASNAKPGNSGSESGNASVLRYLKEIGCAFQGNLGSFAGMYGEKVRRVATRLLQERVYSHFGTDIHSAEGVEMMHNIGLSSIRESSQEQLIASKQGLAVN